MTTRPPRTAGAVARPATSPATARTPATRPAAGRTGATQAVAATRSSPGGPAAAAQARRRPGPRTSPTRTPGARIRWAATSGPGRTPSRWHPSAGNASPGTTSPGAAGPLSSRPGRRSRGTRRPPGRSPGPSRRWTVTRAGPADSRRRPRPCPDPVTHPGRCPRCRTMTGPARPPGRCPARRPTVTAAPTSPRRAGPAAGRMLSAGIRGMRATWTTHVIWSLAPRNRGSTRLPGTGMKRAASRPPGATRTTGTTAATCSPG